MAIEKLGVTDETRLVLKLEQPDDMCILPSGSDSATILHLSKVQSDSIFCRAE